MTETDDKLIRMHTRWIEDWKEQIKWIDDRKRFFADDQSRQKAREEYLEWIAHAEDFLSRKYGR